MLLEHIQDIEKRSDVMRIAYGLYKQSKEQLVGGKADGMPDSKYNKPELKKGISHELEHVKNRAMAKEISKDHLEENPRYYSLLDKAKIE